MWIQDILNKKPHILALSPMADMTDSAFCQIVRQIGGADIVFREMVSSEAIVRHNEKTFGMTDFVESERPIVQQIFGADPKIMAQAAALVMEHAGPEGIDINMGCPVYKITSNFNGAALMKDPDLAAAIVREMKRAIGDTPLSVKIRLGWDDPDTFKTFIPVLEQAGAQLITIHGRTKKQSYSGKSDWERIRQAKEIASVPLLANGDIHEWHQVDEALTQTKADGVLIARGALGNPWFFKQYTHKNGHISMQERCDIVLAHAKLHVQYHHWVKQAQQQGNLADVPEQQLEHKALVTFRKHLAWYFKSHKMGIDIPGIKEWRGRLVRVNTMEELEMLLEEIKSV